MTQRRTLGVGQVGQARQVSGDDPRARRNAAAAASDRDLGDGVGIDARGRSTLKLDPPLVLRNGRAALDLAALRKALPTSGPITFDANGVLTFTPGARVDLIDETALLLNLATVQALAATVNQLIAALVAIEALEG